VPGAKRLFPFLSIPISRNLSLPFQVGRVVVENLASRMIDTELPIALTTSMADIRSSAVQSLSPINFNSSLTTTVTPSVFKPFAEIYGNCSFTGAPIHPQPQPSDEGKPAFKQFKRGTSDISKAAAHFFNDWSGGDNFQPGWINVRPDDVEHVLNAYGTEWMRTLYSAYDFTKLGGGLLQGQIKPGDLQISGSDFPILRRYWGSDEGQSFTSQYYDTKTMVKAAEAAVEGNADTDKSVAADSKSYIESHKVDVAVIPQLKNADHALTTINKKISRIEASDTLSPAEIKVKVRDQLDLREVEYRKFLAAYRAKYRAQEVVDDTGLSAKDKSSKLDEIQRLYFKTRSNLEGMKRHITGEQAPQGRPPEDTVKNYDWLLQKYRDLVGSQGYMR
jgi:hypothetical protein